MGEMATWIVKLLVNALAIFLVGNFLPGIHVPDFTVALIAAFVLGIANTFIRPILMLITLPINLITLGLFTFVLNGFMFWLATKVVHGFVIDSFITAVIAALIVSVIKTVLDRILLGKDGKVGGE